MRCNSNKYSVIVSLDVHEKNTYLYAVDINTGEVLSQKNIIGNISKVIQTLDNLKISNKSVILYEAGSCGYAPYRKLTKNGYDCQIIAPSSIPKRNKLIKSDKTDAISNLSYFQAGVLQMVSIPSGELEDAREMLRHRYNLVWQITKEKQKVQSLVKRKGYSFTEGRSSWSRRHLTWLKNVELKAHSRSVLNMMLDKIDQLNSQVVQIDEILNEIISQSEEVKDVFKRLQYLPGIGFLTAATLVLEIGDLNRFAHPSAFMNYVGLIPGKLSSGTIDPALKITKAGNRYLRYVLVQAASSYRDRRRLHPKSKIVKMPEDIRSVIERCQNRLLKRYKHLIKNGKNSNKAKVAVARELCGFIWEIVTNNKTCISFC